MNILELMLGQIPEALYFALFMIFTKNIKTKKFEYIILMTAEYLLLTYFIKYSIWFQIIYTVMQFLLLKTLYKEKAQVTDIFTFTIASVVLILVSCISYVITWVTVNNYYVAVILCRTFLFLFLLVFHKKLPRIQKVYKVLWNRSNNKVIKMKSVTFRAINIVIFNIAFYVINLGLLFTLLIGRGV